MNPPTLKADHLSRFQLETLFYMFFAMPRDILQACAAQELYRREWKYHGEFKTWFKLRTPTELQQNQPSVSYSYFDVQAWETRLFTNAFRGNLAAGMLSEEDVRIKIPPPPTNLPLPPSQGTGGGGVGANTVPTSGATGVGNGGGA